MNETMQGVMVMLYNSIRERLNEIENADNVLFEMNGYDGFDGKQHDMYIQEKQVLQHLQDELYDVSEYYMDKELMSDDDLENDIEIEEEN